MGKKAASAGNKFRTSLALPVFFFDTCCVAVRIRMAYGHFPFAGSSLSRVLASSSCGSSRGCVRWDTEAGSRRSEGLGVRVARCALGFRGLRFRGSRFF